MFMLIILNLNVCSFDLSFIEGCSNAEAYSFIQWGIIDIFVYFSHHFITIPPPCWVHAAHLHGVPILGNLHKKFDYLCA